MFETIFNFLRESAENAVSFVNDALYSYILIILLVLGGIYFSIRTKFVQFRLLGEQLIRRSVIF